MQSAAGGAIDPNAAGGGVAAAAAAQDPSQLNPAAAAAVAPPATTDPPQVVVVPNAVVDAPPPADPDPLAAAAATDALLINSIILRDTGRDHGPDFALDNDIIQLETAKTGIDNNNSITEVLNKLAFLCNTTRNGSKINGKHSIDKTKYGAHDPATGKYTNNGNGAAGDTLFGSAAAKGPLFYLTTMTAAADDDASGAVIPQGLLKRTGGGSELYDAAEPIAVGSTKLINGVMRDCITQMVNILENTREVFGPKGWTALFKNVVGGGGGDVKKRTRRHHRHGYSSKKY